MKLYVELVGVSECMYTFISSLGGSVRDSGSPSRDLFERLEYLGSDLDFPEPVLCSS